jgi:hypothetical protein
MHPFVPMIQALAKHVEQLVALPDELRETAICKYKRFCDSCGCHNERELAACLATEQRPRAEWQDQTLAGRRYLCTYECKRRTPGACHWLSAVG